MMYMAMMIYCAYEQSPRTPYFEVPTLRTPMATAQTNPAQRLPRLQFALLESPAYDGSASRTEGQKPC